MKPLLKTNTFQPIIKYKIFLPELFTAKGTHNNNTQTRFSMSQDDSSLVYFVTIN